MRTARHTATLVAVVLLCLGSGASAAEVGSVAGRVVGAAAPLATAQVYAYQLSELQFEQAITDAEGRFNFESLPAGLYKIIAFKSGFLPTVALLTRASEGAAQFLEMQLVKADETMGSANDFWSIRQQIPSDVLRDIEVREAFARNAAYGGERMVLNPASLEADVAALAGVESLSGAAAQVSGGQVGVQTAINDVRIGVRGDFVNMDSREPFETVEGAPFGRARTVALDVANLGNNSVHVSSLDNQLATRQQVGDDIDFASHRVAWSRTDQQSRADFSAQYIEESNYYTQSSIGSTGAAPESRTLDLEGSYTTTVSDRAHVEAGFRYRERTSDYEVDSSLLFPQERVELFGRAGHRVNPSFLVEYGLYSTLRDGSVSFIPQGGVVMKLGEQWRAATTASHKAYDEPLDENPLRPDFNIGLFSEYSDCRSPSEYCYQLAISKLAGNTEKMRFGALHRKFDETLRLHFDRNFFNHHENIVLVEGDSIPELQFMLTHRISDSVMAKLQSNVGAGGGGLLFLTDQPGQFENRVSYVVTSLDTQFQATDTGVFVAFHRLEQELSPLAAQPSITARMMELEKLQLMLTQDLDVLGALASNFALHLNMELSKGSLPTSVDLDEDDLRRRITGGVAVKF